MADFPRRGGSTVLGMIHLRPLPGTPFHQDGTFDETLASAVRSAVALERGGADGALVQTVDRVYSVADESDPARTAAMGLIVDAVNRATGDGFHVGVQMMRQAVSASLAVAKVAGGSFVRVGALVGQTLSAHGMVTPDPLHIMEYRRKIAGEGIGLIADIDSMHFSWFGGGKSTAEVARAARGAGADAVALCHRDDDTTLRMIDAVRAAAPDLPVILAGHTHHGNAARLLAAADGAFVGSCLEREGWGSEIDAARVEQYMDAVRRAPR
ncbi:BtpA/SgcQ family protein [Streptomyces sp. NPDC020742]|uniref:BtpA/SgcQ family protein n=1 Tax=Streptomyces sp. NPDC020742 TaxID=3154897 RepID=UPI0033EE33A7